MENDISEKLIWEWCGRWIELAKTQCKKTSLQTNKGRVIGSMGRKEPILEAWC